MDVSIFVFVILLTSVDGQSDYQRRQHLKNRLKMSVASPVTTTTTTTTMTTKIFENTTLSEDLLVDNGDNGTDDYVVENTTMMMLLTEDSFDNQSSEMSDHDEDNRTADLNSTNILHNHLHILYSQLNQSVAEEDADEDHVDPLGPELDNHEDTKAIPKLENSGK
jgi:hypothetical protein